VTHEERFDRIDQRLEAITMNLEIVAGMQLTNEKAIEANTRAIEANTRAIEANTRAIGANAKAIEANAKAIEANESAIASLTQHTIQAMGAINRLANIAEAHQQRIEDLEHGKQ
jgi:hypothetical protein